MGQAGLKSQRKYQSETKVDLYFSKKTRRLRRWFWWVKEGTSLTTMSKVTLKEKKFITNTVDRDYICSTCQSFRTFFRPRERF